jgi:hypothetical protein
VEALADTLVAIDASARDAGVLSGGSNGAYAAMNWASWENRIRVARRTDTWRMAFRIHPDSSRRRALWSTKDWLPVEPKPRFKNKGPAWAYGYRSGKSMAGLMAVQQKIENEVLRPLLDRMAQMAHPPLIIETSHIDDAVMYGAMKHQAIEWKVAGNHALWWDDEPQIKQQFYERTGEIVWPVTRPHPPHSTGLDRSQNAMLLRERQASPKVKSFKMAGRPYRMRRNSTA